MEPVLPNLIDMQRAYDILLVLKSNPQITFERLEKKLKESWESRQKHDETAHDVECGTTTIHKLLKTLTMSFAGKVPFHKR